jgi:hypothetical protein
MGFDGGNRRKASVIKINEMISDGWMDKKKEEKEMKQTLG